MCRTAEPCFICSRAGPAQRHPIAADFSASIAELEAEPTKGIGQRFGFKH